MSKASIRTVNLKKAMPTVEEARRRLKSELERARRDGIPVLKLIHGYGSSGRGGSLKHAVRSSLRRRIKEQVIESFVPGEEWQVLEEKAQKVLLEFPSLKRDPDLNQYNEGVTIVVLGQGGGVGCSDGL